MPPLLVAIGTWYGIRDGADISVKECIEIVEILIENGTNLKGKYTVDINGQIMELTPKI